jgi:phytoene desaturase
MKETVGVIGGGLGGLSAACTLAARGYRVQVFEKNEWLGGKAAVLETDGFRFDMGPTILTVPRVLRRIFDEAGKRLEDELDLVRLDPQWRCFFEDGGVLDLAEDIETMVSKIDDFSLYRDAGAGYRDFMELSKRLHEVSDRFFFWKSVEDLKDTIDFKANMSPETLRDVMAIRMGQTMAGNIRRRVPDGRVAQMIDHFAQYVGSSPYNSPAVLCSIAHMQVEGGVWYPIGGTRAVPEALVALAESLGVEFRTGCGVRRLIVEGDRVVGLQTEEGELVELSAVVSNMDSIRTYRELVGGPVGERVVSRHASQLRLFPRSEGGVRLDLREGGAGARSDLLPGRAGADRAWCGAGGRRGSLHSRPHTLSARAP